MTASGLATVARQEFRLRIRAGRWKALLVAFFLVLLVFTVLLRGAMGSLAPEDLPYTGTVLFGGLVLFVLALFIYPFVYGFWLSLQPKTGPVLANYTRFFSDSFLYGTIATTLWLALPVTLLNLALAVPIVWPFSALFLRALYGDLTGRVVVAPQDRTA